MLKLQMFRPGRFPRPFISFQKSESHRAETFEQKSTSREFGRICRSALGLTGGEVGNSSISNSLAGFVCSPPPSREQTWLATSPIFSLKTLRPSLFCRQGVNRRSARTDRKNAVPEGEEEIGQRARGLTKEDRLALAIALSHNHSLARLTCRGDCIASIGSFVTQ